MKWPLFRLCFIVFVAAMVLTACGAEQSSSPQLGYKEIKSMVVDILKTDEGKKAVEEALGSGSGGTSSSGSMGMRMISAQSGEQIRTAVKDTLVSDEYKKEIEKIMTDPKFAGDFAKAINSESKQLHMQLIKDPTYQKAIQDMLKSPDVMKSFLELTNTPDYRKQSMTVMQEAMQNPLFRMEVLELLKSVVKEELQPKVEKKKQGEGQAQGEQGSGGGSGENGGEGGEESGESGGGG
ncbi:MULTISPECIES: spore germination lipoprotein GerD [unclassified Paenibacillus]|uniref:spore germination lipoprotein GerD n=1 Tax=unclassified Paenibacillus TaxID=185978 RepID=UPI0011656676|nr:MULTISPECIES: spore germination lipoprotein GerD [unclassified Paenibacillus]AWP25587.1 spore gernimation protein [Paenibacillus sp. Cedars]MDH6675260.1 spore germination protein D [Paenibacillus sp. LBL]